MIRIQILCEGQTEETFVNEILGPFFASKNMSVSAPLLGKTGHKGGNVTYERVQNNVRNLLYDPHIYVTTLFDFYGLSENFPGKHEALQDNQYIQRQKTLITGWMGKMRKDIGIQALQRFIPYIQMYEFEALLFSNPQQIALSVGHAELKSYFENIRQQFSSPEEINNSPTTAPSKRIELRIPDYEKPQSGTIIAQDIGLSTIRSQCLLFNEWISKLENLPELK